MLNGQYWLFHVFRHIYQEWIDPWHDRVKATPAGTQVVEWGSKTKQFVPVHLDLPLFWKSHSQGFWYFARSRGREFQLNPRNPAKFTKTRDIPRNSLEILPNTCRHNIFESYLGCWGCLLAVNLLIYLETSSPQRVNNILKLPGVLRLMLRKTGKQRCKNPGVPREDRGNWGWEYDRLFYRVFALREECRVLWRITPLYVYLTYKDDDLFGNG